MTQVRVTISIDSLVVKQLRAVQSKKLETAERSVSLSKVIEETLLRGLKK